MDLGFTVRILKEDGTFIAHVPELDVHRDGRAAEHRWAGCGASAPFGGSKGTLRFLLDATLPLNLTPAASQSAARGRRSASRRAICQTGHLLGDARAPGCAPHKLCRATRMQSCDRQGVRTLQRSG